MKYRLLPYAMPLPAVAPLAGGRGLKSNEGVKWSPDEQSPPSRGAWIEISWKPLSPSCRRVAPLAGGVD